MGKVPMKSQRGVICRKICNFSLPFNVYFVPIKPSKHQYTIESGWSYNKSQYPKTLKHLFLL